MGDSSFGTAPAQAGDHASAAPADGAGGDPGDQDAKRRRNVFVLLAIIGLIGYVVMGVAMARGGNTRTGGGSAPLGDRVSGWIDGLTGVDPASLTVAYQPARPFRWQPHWRFDLDADEVCTIQVPATGSTLFDNRSIGLRIRIGDQGGEPAARIVYTLPDPTDPRANNDLRDKLTGSDNAVTLPRKPQQDEKNPDLLAGRLTLLLCAATLTVTNTAGVPILVEVF